MTLLVGALIAVGMLVVLPLGLRLVEGLPVSWARAWPVVSAPAVVAMVLPRGWGAGALAAPYAGLCTALALVGVRRLVAARELRPTQVATATALVTPAVAAHSLVAERAGYELLGFDLTVLLLTVAHFHYAGFAAALIAGLACTAAPGRLTSYAAMTVPAGTFVVFLGYFTSDEVELAGAAILTSGMWAVGWSIWRDVRPAVADPLTRGLLAGSAVVLVLTMLLALSWAIGEVWPAFPHFSVTWMAATHGVANALGFAVCGVLAWRRLRRERLVQAT
jgi:hypothetical protein